MKTFIFALVLFVSALGTLVYMWLFTNHLGGDLQENMQALHNEAIAGRQYDQLQSELDETAAQREQLNQYVLDDESDTISLLSLIDDLANRLGITVSTKSLDVKVTEAPGFDLLVAEFSVSGPERSVMKMLQLFESLPYQSQVTSLSVTRSSSPDTGLRTMEQNLSLQISIVEG